MSNNQETMTEEETLEEMSKNYQLESAEYDDNDEGTVEYLDLDLEVDCIPESTEEYIPEVISPKTKPIIIESSALKPNYMDSTRLKQKQVEKTIRAKQTKNIVNQNSTNQSVKRKSDSQASAGVHEAVNAINAKLADSAQSINGSGRNIGLNERINQQSAYQAADEDAEALRINKNEIKTEGDSLDLFFQSMAQTVLHLPSHVQAKIKMDICKVIAMAEIKYGSPDAGQDTNKF